MCFLFFKILFNFREVAGKNLYNAKTWSDAGVDAVAEAWEESGAGVTTDVFDAVNAEIKPLLDSSSSERNDITDFST